MLLVSLTFLYQPLCLVFLARYTFDCLLRDSKHVTRRGPMRAAGLLLAPIIPLLAWSVNRATTGDFV